MFSNCICLCLELESDRVTSWSWERVIHGSPLNAPHFRDTLHFISNFKFRFRSFHQSINQCRIPESEFDPQRPWCLRLRWTDIGLQRPANRALLWRRRLLVVVSNILLLAGPKTNWIVGTKSSIGVDSNTVIIDKLTDSGEVRDLTQCFMLAVLLVVAYLKLCACLVKSLIDFLPSLPGPLLWRLRPIRCSANPACLPERLHHPLLAHQGREADDLVRCVLVGPLLQESLHALYERQYSQWLWIKQVK